MVEKFSTSFVDIVSSAQERFYERKRKRAGRDIFKTASNLRANGIPLNLVSFGWDEETGTFLGYEHIRVSAAVEAFDQAREAGLLDGNRREELLREVYLIAPEYPKR